MTLCFANSVIATRYHIQDEMLIQNTACDDTLIALTIAVEELACLCRCAADISGNEEVRELALLTTCAADHVYCSVCGCMQTQHKVRAPAGAQSAAGLPVGPHDGAWRL